MANLDAAEDSSSSQCKESLCSTGEGIGYLDLQFRDGVEVRRPVVARTERIKLLCAAEDSSSSQCKETVRGRSAPVSSRQVVSVGFIEGGTAHNVIPETLKFGGTFRSTTMEGLSYLSTRIREIIEAQATVHQCTATVDFFKDRIPYPPTVNDESMYSHAKRVGESLLGESSFAKCEMIMGAEDFSFYSQKMPSSLFWIGIRNDTQKPAHPLHSPHFTDWGGPSRSGRHDLLG
ncbi:IAA-amino acid hydrolase ILR1-like 7 [Acorus calamus]|uniref:IAA-amino acid hydrolase ILR1-like 7 n=1 Tax=Acorus calamus TaxID=4465 RepID=A0AAV9DJW1_ACOCL|nr:IAA-amino acid hydrolase ILR1-like 7 [Acorus calamus]